MSRPSAFCHASASLLGLYLVACGGAGIAPPEAPAATDAVGEEREPTSISEAQDQIAKARAELDRDRGRARDRDADGATASDDEPMTPGTVPGASPSGEPQKAPRQERATAAPADSCASSCRALSSMRRAVTALCRMTGDEDTRCADARRTLGESESRVARCNCAP